MAWCFFCWCDAVPSPIRRSTCHQSRWQISCIHVVHCWHTHVSLFLLGLFGTEKPPLDTNFTIAVNVSAFSASDWTPLEASSPIELREAFGVLCLIELLWGAAAPYVFSLIELFPGPVEAGSARQSPLIFLNDVASVSVNLRAAAARRGLLWLTSQRDKQSSLLDTDEGTITSTLPKEHQCYQQTQCKVNK